MSENLSPFLLIKEILRLGLFLFLLPLGFIFKIFKIKLVYIDESRLGHFFGDSVALLSFFYEENLIFPVKAPCSPFITQSIDKLNNIRLIKSAPIKIITGWLRNYPIFVLNLSNALNPVHDIYNFQKIVYMPRFKFSNLDTKVLINETQLKQARISFRKRFGLKPEKIICFNHRSLEHDKDSGLKHSFRNYSNETACILLKELEKSSLQVINLSDIISESPNVFNLKQAIFNVDDIIFATLICDLYVGDSTGTTVIAQLKKINSFVYNIFPRNFEITNEHSIAWPVNYASTNNTQEINIAQVNLFQTQEHFDFANVQVIVPNKNKVLNSFRNWLTKYTNEYYINDSI